MGRSPPPERIRHPEQSASYNISVAGDHNGQAAVWLVRFTKAVTTRVRAGEILTNHNIVTEVNRIGEWRGKALNLAVSDYVLKPGEGCAILVQDRAAGPIFGAAACTASVGR